MIAIATYSSALEQECSKPASPPTEHPPRPAFMKPLSSVLTFVTMLAGYAAFTPIIAPGQPVAKLAA